MTLKQDPLDDDRGDRDTGLQYVYFYYLTPGSDDHKYLAVYLIDQITPAPVTETKIKQWADAAHAGDLQVYHGDRIEDLEWRHRAYLVFCLREPNIELKDVSFNYSTRTGGNHSFGRTRRVRVDDDLTSVYCVNRRLAHRGGPLTAQDQELFYVDFRFDPEPDPHFIRDQLNIYSHNETGTNMGP